MARLILDLVGSGIPGSLRALSEACSHFHPIFTDSFFIGFSSKRGDFHG